MLLVTALITALAGVSGAAVGGFFTYKSSHSNVARGSHFG